MYMIFYIKEHKNDILKHIERPVEYHEKNYMTLTSNSIRQLNVVNNYSYFKGKNESLLAICNQCLTAMGKRMFKDRLLYPLIDIQELETRYNCIEEFRKDKLYGFVQNDLSKIGDLDKSLRLMGVNILQPYQLYSSYLSYEFVKKVQKVINIPLTVMGGAGSHEDISSLFKISKGPSCETFFPGKNFSEFGLGVF